MMREPKAPWMALCEQAAAEQDSVKLLELVRQINDLVSKKAAASRPIRSR